MALAKNIGQDVREFFSTVMITVVQEKGVNVAFLELIPEDVWKLKLKLKSMRVPDWIYLHSQQCKVIDTII